jgi:hypothetical protein
LTGTFQAGGHHRPFYYYAPAALYAFSPWTLALIPALPWAFRSDEKDSKRLLLCWLLGGLLLLSLPSTKREIYLLPLCPAAAVLAAGWFERETSRALWQKIFVFTMAGALVAGHAALPIAAVALDNGAGLAVSLAAGLFALRLARRPDPLPACAATFLIAAVFVAFPELDRHKNFEPFCRALPALDRIPAFAPDETTRAVIPFYTGRYVVPVRGGTEFIVAVEKNPEDRIEEKLRSQYPHVRLRREFKADRTMLLLANAPP